MPVMCVTSAGIGLPGFTNVWKLSRYLAIYQPYSADLGNAVRRRVQAGRFDVDDDERAVEPGSAFAGEYRRLIRHEIGLHAEYDLDACLPARLHGRRERLHDAVVGDRKRLVPPACGRRRSASSTDSTESIALIRVCRCNSTRFSGALSSRTFFGISMISCARNEISATGTPSAPPGRVRCSHCAAHAQAHAGFYGPSQLPARRIGVEAEGLYRARVVREGCTQKPRAARPCAYASSRAVPPSARRPR